MALKAFIWWVREHTVPGLDRKVAAFVTRSQVP
jgi:hypothetical protein